MASLDRLWRGALALVLAVGWGFGYGADRGLAQRQRYVLPQREAAQYGLYRAWYGQFSRAGFADRLAGAVLYVPPLPAETRPEEQQATSPPEGSAEQAKASQAAPAGTTSEPLMLYLYSEHGRLHAVEAETGRVHWSIQVGDRRLHCERPAVSRRWLAVVHGLKLKLFDRLTGELAWERKLRYTSVVGPAIQGDWIMVPSVGGRVTGFHVEDSTRRWYAVSDSQIFTEPNSVPGSFIWCTMRGNVYAGRYENGQTPFVLPVGSFVAVRPTVWGKTVYVPAHSGFAYALNTADGTLLWRYTAADPIHEPIVATNDSVFIVHLLGTCRCLDRLTGRPRWSTTGVKKILAVSAARVYALSRHGKVIVLDRASGARVGTLPWDPGDLLLTNLQTDRIYAGTRDGFLVCVRELGQKEPLVHRHAAKKKLQAGPPQGKDGNEEKKPPKDAFDF